MLYKINEIFYSIQGEGRWTGRPAIFIRFAGCNLACDYCDTKHEKYMELDATSIIKFLSWWAPHSRDGLPLPMIVLTGGEPTIQDLRPLVQMLTVKGWYIALETNGTNESAIPTNIMWITISPKHGVNYSGWKNILKAGELKVVYDSRIDLKLLRRRFDACWYYIQPKSGDIEPALTFVRENPEWMLSLQSHKLINIK